MIFKKTATVKKYYSLTDWVGGMDRKLFCPSSDFLTENQIFSNPAQPNSVNKHFIVWLLLFFNFSDGANQHQSVCFSSKAICIFPALSLDVYIPPRDIFSYGFPTKIDSARVHKIKISIQQALACLTELCLIWHGLKGLSARRKLNVCKN